MAEQHTPEPHSSNRPQPEPVPNAEHTDAALSPSAEPPPYVPRPEALRHDLKVRGERAVIFGALWLLAGVLITLITYVNALQSFSGGFYGVAWGPAVYGLYRIISGLIMIKKSRTQSVN